MKTIPACLRTLQSITVCLTLPCALLGIAGARAQAHISYVQSTYATNSTSFGVAVDSTGNVYIPDLNQQKIYKDTFVNGVATQTVAITGRSAVNLAVDSAGSLYLADGNVVYKETPSGSGYTETSIGSGFNYAYAIAIDSSGALYITDNANNQVVKETPVAGGTYTQTVLFTGLNSPEGVAVDPSGNVFIADTKNNRALKETLSGGTFTQSVIGSGMSQPQGIGLDAHGNVYIVDAGHVQILREQRQPDGTYLQGLALSLPHQLTGLTVSATGVLYVPDVQGYEFFVETPTEVAESAGTSFGSSPVATATTPMVLSFTFDVSGSLGATPYQVTTQGAPALDFQASKTQAGNACATGVTYAIGDTCTVTAYFSPTAPGQRLGAIVLYGSDGTDIATAYLQGIGTSPMITYSPRAISAFNAGANFVEEQALAVDGVGDVYFYNYPDSTYKTTVATASLARVDGTAANFLAIDGAGNVLSTPYIYGGSSYVGNIGTFAAKATYSPYSSGNVQYIDSQVATGFTSVTGIAVDASGSFFIADTNAGIVYKETFANAGYNQSTVVSGLNKPEGLAVDSTGALYIADTGNSRVLLEKPTGTGTYTQSTLFTGLVSPYAVAVDLQGNVYIGQTAANAPVLKETLANGNYTQSTLTTAEVVSLGVGNNGNVYFNVASQYTSNLTVLDVADAPGPFAFATTPVGSTSTDSPQTVTINNSGNTPLLFSVPATGNNPVLSAGFTLASSSTCPQLTPSSSVATLAVGASCTYSINFTPAVAGTNNGTLTLTDNALNAAAATQVIHLTGTGSGGSLSISPTTQAFTATAVGSTSSSAISVITNSTSSAITLTSGTLTDSTDFTATNNCNGTVAANSTCNVTFTFTPKSAGALSSTYSIASAATPGSPLTVALSSTGTSPSATLSPNSLSYSTVVSTQAYNQTTTLTNSGTAPLSITSFAISGTNASSFTIVTNTCGMSLAAGANCTVTVGFTAIAAGTYTATLTATDNASPTTQTVALTGTVSGTPIASLTPALLSFSTNAGTSSASQTATLKNTGTANLTITSLALAGTNASSFSQTNTCGSTLAAGASCTVNVLFTPSAAGTFTASLTVTDNSGSSSAGPSASVVQTAALSGTAAAVTAADFTLTPTPSSQSSYRGRTVTYTVQLAALLGTSPFNSPVTLTASGLPPGATASFSPAVVTPGTQATATLSVAIPALTGAFQPANQKRTGYGISFALLLAGFGLRRQRKLRWSALLTLFCMLGLTAALTGCGTGNGFAVPTSTSTITITGTSGAIVHSTTVSLTVQ